MQLQKTAGEIILEGDKDPVQGDIRENENMNQYGSHHAVQLRMLPQDPSAFGLFQYLVSIQSIRPPRLFQDNAIPGAIRRMTPIQYD